MAVLVHRRQSAVFLGDRAIRKEYEGPVIRLQIGLEDVDDLKADISRGLKAARG